MRDGLLPGVDRELVLPLHKRLEKLFAKIYLGAKVANLEDTGKGVRATLEGEEVAEKQPIFDRVLVAFGRKPRSAVLVLDKSRFTLDPRIIVQSDEMRRTEYDNIYAIRDTLAYTM